MDVGKRRARDARRPAQLILLREHDNGMNMARGYANEEARMREKRNEGKKRLHAALANQHGEIPSLVFRTDKKRSASAKKHEVATAFTKEGERVLDVAVESGGSADRSIRGQIRIGRVIGNLTKA